MKCSAAGGRPLYVAVRRHVDWIRNSYRVTCDPSCVDRDFVATFLASTYWAQDIPSTTVYKSLDGSLCFSLLEADRQIGFARVITDRATIAYLGDVFVLPEYRGRGLGTWLVECVMSHPELGGLRRWILVTRDAHELYQKVGFRPLARPEGFMELYNPNVNRDA
jgi:GNAT superfamily N-acetyltransferase